MVVERRKLIFVQKFEKMFNTLIEQMRAIFDVNRIHNKVCENESNRTIWHKKALIVHIQLIL